MIKWPLVTRKRHEREVDLLTKAVKNEHQRATQEGRAQVHNWAVDLNFTLFDMNAQMAVGRMRAALQQAETIFQPRRLTLDDIIDAKHPVSAGVPE